jgi:NADH:ubiquinone oxidoreductase subunit 5 (subunit L)/multisubunit Na+/H+ antiporter MnhA subunit
MYGASVGAWVKTNVSEAIWDHHSPLGEVAHGRALIVSLIVALGGIATGLYLYVLRRDLPARITARLGDVYVCIRRRYFVDELVDGYVIPNTLRFAMLQKWFDENVIDGTVNLIGRTNRLAGFFSAWFDKVFIDGAVNGIAAVTQIFGAAFRLLQTGRIQQYAAFAVGGALLTAAWLILS